MGGELKVDSELGKGSDFWFKVPLTTPATKPACGSPSKEQASSTRIDAALQAIQKKRGSILVVDDNRTSLDALAYRLSQKSFNPICTQDPQLAVDLFTARADDFAAVLVDYHMPELDGLELAKRLRESKAMSPDVPILLMTSVTDLDMDEGQKAMVSARIPKPIKESRLWRTLLMALDDDVVSGKVRQPLVTSSLKESSLQGKRFLVVDDNPVNLKVSVKMLEKAGVIVDVAANGKAALEAIAANDYSVVLMDCQMPVMDGFEATREVRRLEEQDGNGSHLPIIAMTASAMKEHQEMCIAAGMDAYLSKPFRPAVLFDLISSFARPGTAAV